MVLFAIVSIFLLLSYCMTYLFARNNSKEDYLYDDLTFGIRMLGLGALFCIVMIDKLLKLRSDIWVVIVAAILIWGISLIILPYPFIAIIKAMTPKFKMSKLYELMQENDELRQKQFESFSMYIEDFWEYNYNLHKKERDLLYEIYNKNANSKAYWKDKANIIDPRFEKEKELNDKYMKAYNKEVWKRNYTINEQELNSFINMVTPYIHRHINSNGFYIYLWLVDNYLALDNINNKIFSCNLCDYFSNMHIPVNRDAATLRIYMEIGEILKGLDNSTNKTINYKSVYAPYESEVMSFKKDFKYFDIERFNMDFGNVPVPSTFERSYYYAE